jgi:hypothetical protein
MNNVWWSFINFLKKLFVPPEYTPLERELLRQVSYLEGEFHRERERYNELSERMLFPPTGPVVEQENVTFSVPNQVLPVSQRRKQLEDLSKQRWLERADRLVQEAEEKMRLRNEESKESSSSSEVQSH